MSVLDLFRLDGKKAVVTGASSGIGKRVALAYAQAGAEVAIAARHSEALDEVTREIAAAGAGEVLPISCDVTWPEQVARMVEQVSGSWMESTSRSATPASSRSTPYSICR
jgi:sorbose reductase